MKRVTGFLAAIVVCVPAVAQQMNCDCTQIVGSCEASIRWEPTGSGVSQGAKLRITSTAPICSKVSYYVDSTPYFNILSRGNTDEDSVFGTKPFTAETLSEIKCQVCRQVSAVRPQQESTSSPNQESSPYAGTWIGEQRNIMGFSHDITLKLQADGNKVTGTWTNEQDGKIDGPHRFTGIANGDELKGSAAGMGITLKLVGDTLQFRWLFGSGKMRKQ